jgi:hypothetical protein
MVESLERLGALTPEEAAAALTGIASWADDLDEELDADDLVEAFEELPIAAYVPDKVESLEEVYAGILEEAAACSRGAVTIDDIEMVDVDGEHYLHFRRNGQSLWWSLEHQSPRYLDLLTIAENFDDLAPSDGRAFFHLQEDEYAGSSGWYVLATPQQARVLREEFGLPLDDWAYTGQPDVPLTATPGTTAWYIEQARAFMDEPSRLHLDHWLDRTGTTLEHWRTDGLDFTLDSLAILEARILERFPDHDPVDAQEAFVESAARYIGETVQRAWPSHWSYRHTDGTGYLKNVPMVFGNTPSGFTGVCVPLYTIQQLVNEREPGILLNAANEVGNAIDLYRRALLARTR